ncbi:MAG: glycosyltransferase, partial [Cyanobacteria bacterium J06632_3]
MATSSASTEPLISVVIPTYGREAVLCDSIKSVLAQTYPAYEL